MVLEYDRRAQFPIASIVSWTHLKILTRLGHCSSASRQWLYFGSLFWHDESWPG